MSALRVYLRLLAILYFAGAILHLADILDLRLKFSEMGSLWKLWIVFLLVADLVAAFGLWKRHTWGIICFLMIAVAQLIAYTIFRTYFGNQMPLVVFHLISVITFFALQVLSKFGSRNETLGT